jgi:elongation factor G
MLVEAAAEADDELMEKYLETETLNNEEILRALREGTLTKVFTPVFCGSATANIGVRNLLNHIVNCLPSPVDRGTQYGVNPKTGEPEAPRRPSRALLGHGVQDHQRSLCRQAHPLPGLFRHPQE